MSSIIQLTKITHSFTGGGQENVVLKNIDLSIAAGEIVAITGPSGSGKSTLLNIMGCLTKQKVGNYYINDQNTNYLSSDQLANLRAKHIGFIFQRYHLMPELTVQQNIEIPSLYTNVTFKSRRMRSASLLNKLGLHDRKNHKPRELSGGQQQRVSIARALMNGGEILLADEPTGALDANSRNEVMEILIGLNQRGHTIVIATHDTNIIQYAHRIIRIIDGEIASDERVVATDAIYKKSLSTKKFSHGYFNSIYAAFQMALFAMNANIFRTLLTMLGIVFGIAAVVTVVALGEGAKQRTLENIRSLGTNIVSIYPGKNYSDSSVHTLLPSDADKLAKQSFVNSVSPLINTSGYLRFRAISFKTSVYGVGSDYFNVNDIKFIQGRTFSHDHDGLQEVIIDESGANSLFGNIKSSIIGKVVLVDSMPLRVIGIVKNNNLSETDNRLSVWMPFSTVIYRLTGRQELDNIVIRLEDNISNDNAIELINDLLKVSHEKKDFRIYNFDKIRKSIEHTSTTFTILIFMVALISLIIGSIGVMNIMLVSIMERKHEIGIRIAMGARRVDIMQQFIIEAMLVSLFGGILGVMLSYAIGPIFSALAGDMLIFIYSWKVTITAFFCSCLIGIIFGYFPARKASLMEPATLLADE
ncbi:MAG: ABC transporter permease [Pantoea agglomerans]